MTASALIFYILASIALVAAVLVIWSRNVMHSAIYLVLTFLCLAGVYVLLNAEFVATVQVFVYAGGIVILFLFLIMLVNIRSVMTKRLRLHATLSAVLGAAVVGQILYLYSQGSLQAASQSAHLLTGGGNLQNVGWALYREYLLPFEIASLFLLVAMIGVIVLTRHKA